MTEKNTLTDEFAKAAKAESVPLTAGEVALVRSVFGKRIDTSQVIKHFKPIDPRFPNAYRDILGQAFGKKDVVFYRSENYSADFSQSKDPSKYRLFVHEITHLWQAQHRLRNYFRWRRYESKYTYHLSQRSRFRHFGIEQQASILGDYAAQFLCPEPDQTDRTKDGRYRPFYENWNSGSLALLQKVVEKKFPEARKTRLALEAQTKAAPTAQTRKLG